MKRENYTLGGAIVVLPPLGGFLLQYAPYSVLFGLTAAFVLVGHLLSWGLPSIRGVFIPNGNGIDERVL